MNLDQQTESLKKCSVEPIHTSKEAVEKLLLLINTEFSKPAVSGEEEDFSLLKQICEAKAEILKSNPFWTTYSPTTMLASRILSKIDWLDIEEQYDGKRNREIYEVIKEYLKKLKDYNPYWKLDEHDTRKLSTCPYCNTATSNPEGK
jgi:hypothetical protein